MPATINGIGTSYYGKENLHLDEGVCEFCDTYAPIKSYDTRLFFCVLYVPLIPLGRKRILDECSHCRRHRVMPLKHWHQLRVDATEEAGMLYKQSPTEENAEKLVLTAASYFDRDLFDLIKESFAKKWAQSHAVMSSLAVAAGHLGDHEMAVSFFQKAHQLDPQNAQTRRNLLLAYLRANQPDDAGRLALASVMNADDVPILRHVVGQLYAMNRTVVGDQLADKLLETFPQLSSDKAFIKLRKSRKAKLQKNELGIKKGASRLSRWFPLAIPVALVLGGLWLVTHAANHADVFLVSGMDDPERVVIDGEIHNLAAFGRKQITLSKGNHHIQLFVADRLIEDEDLFVDKQRLSDAWGDGGWILNPDRVAVVQQQDSYYALNPETAPEGESVTFCGEYFYLLRDVDYWFKKFPKTVELPSSKSTVKKRRVIHRTFVSPLKAIEVVLDDLEHDALVEVLRRWVALGERDSAVLSVYAALDSDDPISLLREHMAAEPHEVAWHRIYQHYRESQGDYDALVNEYRELWEENPQDSRYAYLFARLQGDPDKMTKLFKTAESLEPECPWPLAALVDDLCSESAYEQALGHANKACELMPGEFAFRERRRLALYGLKRFEDLRIMAFADKQLAPDAVEPVVELVTISTLAGRGLPQGDINTFMSHVHNDFESEARQHFQAYFEWLAVYAEGDVKQFMDHALTQQYGGYEYLLLSGKYDELKSSLEDHGDAVDWLLLWLYADALAQTDHEGWTRALEIMRNGTHEQVYMADALEEGAADRFAPVGGAGELSVLWLAMAKRDPKHAVMCRNKARNLNVVPDYPHVAVNYILAR